jgi:hypothetical protein
VTLNDRHSPLSLGGDWEEKCDAGVVVAPGRRSAPWDSCWCRSAFLLDCRTMLPELNATRRSSRTSARIPRHRVRPARAERGHSARTGGLPEQIVVRLTVPKTFPGRSEAVLGRGACGAVAGPMGGEQPTSSPLREGDDILVTLAELPDGTVIYSFYDFERSTPLVACRRSKARRSRRERPLRPGRSRGRRGPRSVLIAAGPHKDRPDQ